MNEGDLQGVWNKGKYKGSLQKATYEAISVHPRAWRDLISRRVHMFLQPDTDPGDWQSSTSSSSGSSSSDSSSLEDDSSSTSVQVGKRPRKVVTLDHTFLQPLTDVLLNSPHGIRLAVKSIINAWTTSSRCNEKKNCLLYTSPSPRDS